MREKVGKNPLAKFSIAAFEFRFVESGFIRVRLKVRPSFRKILARGTKIEENERRKKTT